MTDETEIKQGVNNEIEEIKPCEVCGKEMAEEDVFYKEGLLNPVDEEKKNQEEIKYYCKECVEGDETLTLRSNEMIRKFMSIIIKNTTKEEHVEILEELKKENMSNYELVKDMFE